MQAYLKTFIKLAIIIVNNKENIFHYFSLLVDDVIFLPPYPPLGLIWTVMLVWRKGNINSTVSVL